MDDALFADGIDGFHGLRRRERTRLWYRAFQETDYPAASAASDGPSIADSTPEIIEAPIEYSQDAIDAFLDEWAADAAAERVDRLVGPTAADRQQRILRRLGDFHALQPIAGDVEPEIVSAAEREAITGWRTVPRNAPSLMLSASSMLDTKTAGPILSPGCRYRVLSAEDGIVELHVEPADGGHFSGYCNAVDMSCIDPMIVNLAGGRKASTKQRLSRIGRGISQMTGSLMSLTS